jgi:hypothetical protein
MPKRTIILVYIVTDHLRNECNKCVTFKNQPPLATATGNQPDQNEAQVTIIQCAEVTGERAWSSDDG